MCKNKLSNSLLMRYYTYNKKVIYCIEKDIVTMKAKFILFVSLLLLIAGMSNAQEETIILPPSTAQSVILQRAQDGEWDGNHRGGTLSLINQNPRTQVVVKYPDLTGGVYDTADFNSAWADFGGEVEAVLDLETYNVRLMLSAPEVDGDTTSYEATVIEFVDFMEEARNLEDSFEASRLTLLPSPEFMSAVVGIAVEPVMPEEEGVVFISHLYLQVGTQATYDANTQILTIDGLNPAVFGVREVVSVLSAESLFQRWSLLPNATETAYAGMLTYAGNAVPFDITAPVYDSQTSRLTVPMVLAEGTNLPEVVEFPTLVIMTAPSFEAQMQTVLTDMTSGMRNSDCATATAELDGLLAAYPEFAPNTALGLDATNNTGGTNITNWGTESIQYKIAAASARKDQACGASGQEFPMP
jgi:hypothetical protein